MKICLLQQGFKESLLQFLVGSNNVLTEYQVIAQQICNFLMFAWRGAFHYRIFHHRTYFTNEIFHH